MSYATWTSRDSGWLVWSLSTFHPRRADQLAERDVPTLVTARSSWAAAYFK